MNSSQIASTKPLDSERKNKVLAEKFSEEHSKAHNLPKPISTETHSIATVFNTSDVTHHTSQPTNDTLHISQAPLPDTENRGISDSEEEYTIIHCAESVHKSNRNTSVSETQAPKKRKTKNKRKRVKNKMIRLDELVADVVKPPIRNTVNSPADPTDPIGFWEIVPSTPVPHKSHMAKPTNFNPNAPEFTLKQ